MRSNPISRRQFIQSTAAVSLAFATPKMAWGQTSADVIVVGAGMSGLLGLGNFSGLGPSKI